MEWKRVARLLNMPVDRLRARFSSDPAQRQLAAWEASMESQTKELARLTELFRDALSRRRAAIAEVQAFDDRAEQALREGDDAKARAVLLQKQDAVPRLALAKEESEALATAARRAKERLAATRTEANALLLQAGMPPLDEKSEKDETSPAEPDNDADTGAPRVRVKL
jgi:phage shock protein A